MNILMKSTESTFTLLTPFFCMALVIFGSQNAYAEVLDKFGGCKAPSYYKGLFVFASAILIMRWLKKRKSAKFLIYLSLIYIICEILWSFLASKKIVPSWFDKAIFDFFTEIQNCPQFLKIGYWQQSWIIVLAYLISILAILKFTRPRYQ